MRDAVDIWIKFTKFLLTYVILKVVLHLRIYSYEATFHSKTKSRIESYLFYFEKSRKLMRIQQKSRFFRKKSQVGNRLNQPSWRKQSSNVGPFKGWFPLAYWILNNEVNQTIWLVNMLIILLLTFWCATIQYRKGELTWILLVYMFFNLNIVMMRYFALTSQYIALTRILDTTKREQNNYTHINIYNT